jgi:pyruvate/2-oxoglutarate dehydrogenase complex dihydrolipoamide acyltransferase (E2) component
MPTGFDIIVPLLSVNDTHLTVVSRSFEQGAAVKKGDIVLVFETSKTTYDVVAEESGFIGYRCLPGQEYPVSFVVASIYADAAEIPEAVPLDTIPDSSSKKVNGQTIQEKWTGETVFSRSAIELLERHGIDKELFSGLEMVSRHDVENLLGKQSPDSGIGITRQAASMISLQADPDQVELIPISANKKREIEYLSQVQHTGLTSTIHSVVETRSLLEQLNNSLEHLRNNLLPVVAFEVSRLLPFFPELNSYFTGDSIARYRDVNIGFAIDIDQGLKVLNLRNTNLKSIRDIESDILRLSDRYLDNRLEIGDLTDITFTITDLSGEGVFLFKPLVNALNSAILGISSVDQRMGRCVLSLTFDHRITEGKKAAGFLTELRERLETYRSSHSVTAPDISCFKCMKSLKEDLSDTGFVRCITPEGEEAYICQSCFKGF